MQCVAQHEQEIYWRSTLWTYSKIAADVGSVRWELKSVCINALPLVLLGTLKISMQTKSTRPGLSKQTTGAINRNWSWMNHQRLRSNLWVMGLPIQDMSQISIQRWFPILHYYEPTWYHLMCWIIKGSYYMQITKNWKYLGILPMNTWEDIFMNLFVQVVVISFLLVFVVACIDRDVLVHLDILISSSTSVTQYPIRSYCRTQSRCVLLDPIIDNCFWLRCIWTLLSALWHSLRTLFQPSWIQIVTQSCLEPNLTYRNLTQPNLTQP